MAHDFSRPFKMEPVANNPKSSTGSPTYRNGGSSMSAGGLSNGSNSPSLSPKSSPLNTSSDTLNSSASVSSGVGSNFSSASIQVSSVAASPGSTNLSLADYLSQLIKDKKQLSGFGHAFFHVERLLDEEINRVRVNLFQLTNQSKSPLTLPEPEGTNVTLSEKVYVPCKEYPDFNFVGRILGPRGMTAKQLERDTGCKIMIRGKGSMRDKQKEQQNKGKPNWEHLNDELHVLINVEDTPDRARMKLGRAVEEVNRMLVPCTEAEDELKKRQLMELAIMNGTYRDNSVAAANAKCANQFAQAAQAAAAQYYVDPAQLSLAIAANQFRQQTLGNPLMLHQQSRQAIPSANGTTHYYPANALNEAAAAAGLVYNPYEYSANLAASLLHGEYQLDRLASVGGVMKQNRHLGNAARDALASPYARPLLISNATAATIAGAAVQQSAPSNGGSA